MSAAELTDDDYRPIATAPRDGTLIEVMDPEAGAFPMRWNPEGFNMAFSRKPGLWESVAADVTWTEDNDCGPTMWRPYKPGRYRS